MTWLTLVVIAANAGMVWGYAVSIHKLRRDTAQLEALQHQLATSYGPPCLPSVPLLPGQHCYIIVRKPLSPSQQSL